MSKFVINPVMTNHF